MSSRLVRGGANHTIARPVGKQTLRDIVAKTLDAPNACQITQQISTVRCFSRLNSGLCYIVSPDPDNIQTGATFGEAKGKLFAALRSFNGAVGFTHTEKIEELALDLLPRNNCREAVDWVGSIA